MLAERGEATSNWPLHLIPLSGTERGELLLRLRAGLPGFCTRSALMDVVPSLVRSIKPEAVPNILEMRALFPKGSLFSFSAAEEVLLVYILAGRLVHPELPLIDGMIAFVKQTFEGLVALPLFNPIFRACEHDPQLFIDIAVKSSSSLFFNRGTAEHTRHGRDASSVLYEDYPSQVMEPLFRGFYSGLLPYLTKSDNTSVEYEVISNSTGELMLAW